ncbi:hypothetical protein BLNAU_15564 [Blattamonas nauphoetae]|uniref:Uncharacterized protein n=1 Tax=Blattamonas nauphoetae TaxID=2049346 RepID=A0ABQ9XAC7_9EUKA|nr:hypothetical protein BLNAU_15564 [Blattamonas nauphoetae]
MTVDHVNKKPINMHDRVIYPLGFNPARPFKSHAYLDSQERLNLHEEKHDGRSIPKRNVKSAKSKARSRAQPWQLEQNSPTKGSLHSAGTHGLRPALTRPSSGNSGANKRTKIEKEKDGPRGGLFDPNISAHELLKEDREERQKMVKQKLEEKKKRDQKIKDMLAKVKPKAQSSSPSHSDATTSPNSHQHQSETTENKSPLQTNSTSQQPRVLTAPTNSRIPTLQRKGQNAKKESNELSNPEAEINKEHPLTLRKMKEIADTEEQGTIEAKEKIVDENVKPTQYSDDFDENSDIDEENHTEKKSLSDDERKEEQDGGQEEKSENDGDVADAEEEQEEEKRNVVDFTEDEQAEESESSSWDMAKDEKRREEEERRKQKEKEAEKERKREMRRKEMEKEQKRLEKEREEKQKEEERKNEEKRRKEEERERMEEEERDRIAAEQERHDQKMKDRERKIAEEKEKRKRLNEEKERLQREMENEEARRQREREAEERKRSDESGDRSQNEDSSSEQLSDATLEPTPTQARQITKYGHTRKQTPKRSPERKKKSGYGGKREYHRSPSEVGDKRGRRKRRMLLYELTECSEKWIELWGSWLDQKKEVIEEWEDVDDNTEV